MAVSSATDSITGAFSLVTKVYFPREVLPTAAVLTKIVDLGFGLIIRVALMVYLGYPRCGLSCGCRSSSSSTYYSRWGWHSRWPPLTYSSTMCVF